MDLSIKFNNYNILFGEKFTKFSKENMDRLLLPLVKDGIIDINCMSSKTGYTVSAIENWFVRTFGMSVSKYRKNKHSEMLKNELENFYKQGVPMCEVAKHYGYSVSWVNNKYVQFGFKHQSVRLDSTEKEELSRLVQAGFPIAYIAEKLQCSKTTVQKWVDINIKGGLVKFRHENGIILKHKNDNKDLELVRSIQKLFDEDKNIKEIAQILGISSQKVLRLKQKYNIKSKIDLAYDKIEELFPKMAEKELTIKQISNEVGLSVRTIRRWIQMKFGKSYTELKKEI